MPPAQEGSFLVSMFPLFVLFAIFYFLVIRPQQKQAKEHKQMIDDLKKGDKIITSGGLICEVVKVEADFIKLKLNNDVTVKLNKEYIARKAEQESESK